MSITLERLVDPTSGSPPPAQIPGTPSRHAVPWWHPVRLIVTESGLVAFIAFVAYLTAALVLDFVFRIVPLDAVSRMANGYYVVFSRDPHLAAVGFVWSPLQSFADIPFLLLKPFFPVMATHDLAGSLVSVLAGVGAIHQLHAALREWGVHRLPRLVLTLLFGVNPMVLYYSANGMSDMLYVFLLVLTTRYLLRWIRSDDPRALVYAGCALGVAYLDRYEALGAAALATMSILWLTFKNSGGTVKGRLMAAVTDATVFLMPIGATFTVWAIASYVIVGQAFAGVSSQYGTEAQTSEATHLDLTSRVLSGAHNLEYLAPLLPLALIVAVAVAMRRRDPLLLAPLAILGGSVAFDSGGLLVGFLEPWYRYFIVSIPLDIMLVGCILAAPNEPRHAKARWSDIKWRDVGDVRQGRRVAASLLGTVFALLLVGPSVPLSGRGIFASDVQSSESTELGALFLAHPSKVEWQWSHHFAHIQAIDRYIAAMHLKDGAIVADTYGNCTPQIVTSVPNSKVFVITSDRDFQRTVANPLGFGADYLLVPQPVGVGLVDAINVEYPNMYATGAGIAKLVHQFNSDGICAVYRLYRVTKQT